MTGSSRSSFEGYIYEMFLTATGEFAPISATEFPIATPPTVVYLENAIVC